MEPEKIYVQKVTAEGEPEAEVKELGRDFGFYGMEIPFTIATEAKEPSRNDWKDEDGDDEYVPPGGLKLQAFETELKLGYKGAKDTANAKIEALVDYLTGRDGSGASFKIYSTWTKKGYGGVRFASLGDDAELVRDDGGDILVITLTLKVNDPGAKVVLG